MQNLDGPYSGPNMKTTIPGPKAKVSVLNAYIKYAITTRGTIDKCFYVLLYCLLLAGDTTEHE